MNRLFLFDVDNTVFTCETISIEIPNHFEQTFEEIFEETYDKLQDRLSRANPTEKRELEKNAINQFRRYLAGLSVTGEFHFQNPIFCFSGEKNPIQNGLVVLQKEWMFQESEKRVPLNELNEVLCKQLEELMKTVCFCTIMGK